MNVHTYIHCNQCGYFHEAYQSPASDKRLRFTRYTRAELVAIHQSDFTLSGTSLLACPSKVTDTIAPAKAKPKRAA